MFMKQMKDKVKDPNSAAAIIDDFRHHGGMGGTYCDYELNEAIDRLYAAGYGADADYVPYVSDHDFFHAVSCIDPNNFPTLAVENFITREEITGFLFDNEIGDLYRNNRNLVEAAQNLKISPVEFTDLYHTFRENRASEDEFIRAMELQVALRKPSKQVQSIVHETMNGSIRYEDAEFIGFDRLTERGRSAASLKTAMIQLHGTGRDIYTLADILAVYEGSSADEEAQRQNDLEWSASSRAARLDLMVKFGGKEALGFKHPIFIDNLIERQPELGRNNEKTKSLLHYMEALYSATNCTKKLLPPKADIPTLHELGVDPEMAVKEYTNGADLWRVTSIHEGSAPALVDGWL
jgi:hypothetical protein